MRRSTWVTQSGHVIEGPATIIAVALTSTGTGAADATLHVGRDDTAQVLTKIRCTTSNTNQVDFTPGVQIPDGLFVALGSNVDGLLVIYDDEVKPEV